VRTYADSSFILRLISPDAATSSSIDEYRRLDHPALFFLPFHELEVRTGILQRAFFDRHSGSALDRKNYRIRRDAALARFERFLARGHFLAAITEVDAVFVRAVKLSAAHTENSGARSLDLLHVAYALELKTDLFLSADGRQARVAKAEGLKTILVE
jgi:predicted nucleic acid-binding protein